MACFLSELCCHLRSSAAVVVFDSESDDTPTCSANREHLPKMRVGIVIPITQIVFDIQAIQPRVIVPQKRKTF